MPHAILAGQNSLDNLYDGLVPAWRLRSGGSFLVGGNHVHEQLPYVQFVDDFKIRQRKKQRLTYAEGGHARGTI